MFDFNPTSKSRKITPISAKILMVSFDLK